MNEYDRLGKFMWDMFKDEIVKTFKHHPNKDEILERLATSSFIVAELDKWFEEAAFYTNMYWDQRFRGLAEIAREEGVNFVKFRKVHNGEESQYGKTSRENCKGHEH